MLNFDQDKFITDYVTTFLATDAATNPRREFTDDWMKTQPVEAALKAARYAWCCLIEKYGPQYTIGQTIPPCPVGECDIKGVHHHNHGRPVNSGERA